MSEHAHCAIPTVGGDHACPPEGRARHPSRCGESADPVPDVHHVGTRSMASTTVPSTIAELLEHGDFGVGTFNHLDGEMVVNEGVCFHLFSSGEARVASADDLTPFAAVTTFEADTTFDVQSPTPQSDLLAQIDASVSRARTCSMGSGSRGRFANVVHPDRRATGSPLPAAGRKPPTTSPNGPSTQHDRCPRRLPNARLRAGHLRGRLSPAFPQRRSHRRRPCVRFRAGQRSRGDLHRVGTPAQPADVWAVPHGRSERMDMDAEIRKSEG